MTNPMSVGPEADGNARRPRWNADPLSIFLNGVAPLGRRSIASIPCTSRVGSSTATSATVTMADTSGVNVGDLVMGAGVSPNQAVTTTDTNDLFVLAAHGMPLGTPVWLVSIATTTGIIAARRYYVVTPGAGGTAGNFALAATPGGTPIAITTDGTAVIRAERFVQSISANTSITLNAVAPVTAAGQVLKFATVPSIAF